MRGVALNRGPVFAWASTQPQPVSGAAIARQFGCSPDAGEKLRKEWEWRSQLRAEASGVGTDGLGTPPLPRHVFYQRRSRPLYLLDAIAPADKEWAY